MFKERDLRVLRGLFLNPTGDRKCLVHADGLLAACKVGKRWLIEDFGPAETVAAGLNLNLADIPITEGTILPPFYDTHFHWVQDDVRHMPKTSLLEWLESYTFPEESRYVDDEFANQKAKHFWKRILSTGTVGGLCYSSIHRSALDAAMNYAPEGFRIGGTLMNMNCPDDLKQTDKQSIEEVRHGSSQYGDRYCVTPRFAPTTHPQVMLAASEIAKDHGLFQQTHLCETPNEIEWVLDIYRKLHGFEEVSSYTEIYNRCGMLGPRTVMGHSIHLSPIEWELLGSSETAIASCPTSNAPVDDHGLGSGLFNFERADRYGIRWALATDIGGGPFLSMFDAMDSFVRQNQEAGVRSANYVRALYRSTLAGAKILGFGDSKGNFTKGKSFDCIVCPRPPLLEDPGSAEEILEALMTLVTSRDEFESMVQTTVLNGVVVFEKESSRL